METGFGVVLIDEGLVSVNCFEIVLVDEKGMVNVNCLAFFSKDGPRRCHRTHVGLAFDPKSLYVDLDCKSALSHSDHLFSICPCLLDHSPTLDFESDVSWPHPNLFRSSSHTQNLKNMKDISLSDWFDRIHRSAPLGSCQSGKTLNRLTFYLADEMYTLLYPLDAKHPDPPQLGFHRPL